MDLYKTIKVYGRDHVLRQSFRYNRIQEANYLGTNMALCGILRPNETLDQFIARQKKGKRKD